MRVLRQIGLGLLAATMILAPLLCVRFCHLREALAGAGTPMDMTAMAHDPAMTGHAHHADSDSHDAPLNNLKQMVNSVTEFIATAVLTFLFVVIALRTIRPTPRLRRYALAVPTPPPRLAHI